MKESRNIVSCVCVEKNYYAINSVGELHILNNKFKPIKKIDCNIKYSNITYDEKTKTFFLSEKHNKKCIYKTSDFICHTAIELKYKLSCDIVDISYCPCRHSILITTENKVYKLNLKNCHIKVLYELEKCEPSKLNDCVRPLLCEEIYKSSLIGAICCCDEIYIAYKSCNEYYIAKIQAGKIEKIEYVSKYPIKAMIIMKEELWIVVDNCGCLELVYTGIDCDCCCDDDEDCDCQIIKSIALVEKNIAKILNSEASKIQAVVKKSDNVKDLICVNSSVKDVVYYVTILEFILTEKLKTVKKTDC